MGGTRHTRTDGGSSGFAARAPWAEGSWLMIGPIALLALGALVLGIVPDHAVFLELAEFIVDGVTA